MEDELTAVSIYTDGACSGNPGPGGWAAILVWGERELELSGGESHTTNQRMEIQAVVEGLRGLKRPCKVTVYSDSAYVVNCFTQKWYVKWQRTGWVNSSNQPVKNRDLWELLIEQLDLHDVQFGKVKGHSGHHYNERCDALARAAVKR
ncbi:MAG: ribonuclease HI [Acidibacillus sp.]|uniref:Ribonuclease H n=1 Tax=Sulfoacidibacillus ferrooxidans TaxID=2005001 RepID=A0A9X1V6N3_9BACL|nr:Ribonuclease H [Sulfoacidibacillus ferrooxidans]MCY0894230.1 ribonuclease HI [Acidibacillus sp.]